MSVSKKNRFTTPYSSQTSQSNVSSNSTRHCFQNPQNFHTTTEDIQLSGQYFAKPKDTANIMGGCFPKVTPHTKRAIKEQLARSIKEQRKSPEHVRSPVIPLVLDMSQRTVADQDLNESETKEQSVSVFAKKGNPKITNKKKKSTTRTTAKPKKVDSKARFHPRERASVQVVPTATAELNNLGIGEKTLYEFNSTTLDTDLAGPQRLKHFVPRRKLTRELTRREVLKMISKMRAEIDDLQRRRRELKTGMQL